MGFQTPRSRAPSVDRGGSVLSDPCEVLFWTSRCSTVGEAGGRAGVSGESRMRSQISHSGFLVFGNSREQLNIHPLTIFSIRIHTYRFIEDLLCARHDVKCREDTCSFSSYPRRWNGGVPFCRWRN